jgi:hypothetical protein
MTSNISSLLSLLDSLLSSGTMPLVARRCWFEVRTGTDHGHLLLIAMEFEEQTRYTMERHGNQFTAPKGRVYMSARDGGPVHRRHSTHQSFQPNRCRRNVALLG